MLAIPIQQLKSREKKVDSETVEYLLKNTGSRPDLTSLLCFKSKKVSLKPTKSSKWFFEKKKKSVNMRLWALK